MELHLHLEGAIPLPTLWKLLEKYDAFGDIKSFDQLHDKYRYKNFGEFLNTWVWQNQLLRDYEDFNLIASDVALDLIHQNVIYAELFYSPFLESRSHLDPIKITEAIRNGFDQYSEKIELNLILDFSRDQNPDHTYNILKPLSEIQSSGVVGIGIGGPEKEYPPELFKDVFVLAREMGFKTSAHAGEVAGPESIWGAVQSLKVDRIGHGTAAIQDETLLQYLEEHQIPLELCPVSNVRTGAVADFSDHPIRKYFDMRLLITVNTDDPKMFNTSLFEEYSALVDTFQFSLKEISQLMKNAIASAWCGVSKKKELRERLREYYCEL